jgi:lysyl-tRNA synthetase class I
MANIGHNSGVTVNSLNENDRNRLKNAIREMNDSMTRVAAERDLQKETIKTLHDELGLDKKIVRRMARTYYNANFNSEVEDNKSFEEFYSVIINGSRNNP